MNKKIAFVVLPVSFSLLTVACSHAPTPQTILQQYLAAWQKQDYKQMYSFLSKAAQSRISESQFVSRYKTIYQGISTTSLSVQSSSNTQQTSNDKSGSNDVTLPFKATWQTGITNPFTETYHAHLVKGSSGWKIDWSSNLIFPELKQGWKVHAESQSPTRGQIVTAGGQYLAQNQPGQQIGLVPGKMKSSSAAALAKVLKIPESSVTAALNQSWVKPNLFVPVKTMSQQQEKALEKQLLKIPGVLIATSQETVRVYPQNSIGAHVVGYVGSITAQQLTQKRKQEGYTATDKVGQQGLERSLESQLRGNTGGKIWVTDKSGKNIKVLAQRSAGTGDKVTLTLRNNVNKALAQALGSYVGSAVVLNPSTGAVLGMVSRPGFNPNQLAAGVSSAEWNKLSQAKQSPLINRAVSAVPPGSAIKPLVAGLALQDGAIKPGTTFPGTNHLKWQKDSTWGNFYVTRVPHPSGTVDLKHALIWSDNIYFAQVGLALGQEKFVSGLNQVGFGKKLSFPLTVAKAQISDNGKIDSQIQLANSAYGQGQVLVSPLQLASMYTAFYNNGDVLKPYLIKNVTSASGKVVQQGKKTVLSHQALSPQSISTLQPDLRQIVTDPTGTAHGIAGVPGWTVSGKTGTAQTKANGPEWGWFVAMAHKTRGGSSSAGNSNSYLIVMALANTQKQGGSHLAVHQVRQFLEALH